MVMPTNYFLYRPIAHTNSTGSICNAHPAAREGVAKVPGVKVALVPYTGWKNAAKHTHFGSFTQRLADGLSLPCGRDRRAVRSFWGQGATRLHPPQVDTDALC